MAEKRRNNTNNETAGNITSKPAGGETPAAKEKTSAVRKKTPAGIEAVSGKKKAAAGSSASVVKEKTNGKKKAAAGIEAASGKKKNKAAGGAAKKTGAGQTKRSGGSTEQRREKKRKAALVVKKKREELKKNILTGSAIIMVLVLCISLLGFAKNGVTTNKATEDDGIQEVVASDDVLFLSFPQLVVDEAYETALRTYNSEQEEKASEENAGTEGETGEDTEVQNAEVIKASGSAGMTVSDFNGILQELYDDQYVLIDFYSMFQNTDGNISEAEITVPAGKKPLIIAQRNVSYSEEEAVSGHATSLVYADGKFSNTFVMPETFDAASMLETAAGTDAEKDPAAGGSGSEENTDEAVTDGTENSSGEENYSEEESYTDTEEENYSDGESAGNTSYETDTGSSETAFNSTQNALLKAGLIHPLRGETAVLNTRAYEGADQAVPVVYEDTEETPEDEYYDGGESSGDEEEYDSYGSESENGSETGNEQSGSTNAGNTQSGTGAAAAGQELTGNYDVISCLDAFIETHPDFSYNGARGILGVTGNKGVLGFDAENAEAAKAAANALKAEGWRFACNSYAGVSYGSELAIVESDSAKWKSEVESIVGVTDILLLQGKADIGPWSGYTDTNQRFVYLKDQGFRYYCIHNDQTMFYMQMGTDYARIGLHEVMTKDEFQEVRENSQQLF